MTASKRVGMLLAALITMGGMAELGEKSDYPRGSRFCLNGRGQSRPATDAGECCRRRASHRPPLRHWCLQLLRTSPTKRRPPGSGSGKSSL